MGKIIKNPIVVEITRQDGQNIVFLDYGLGAEEYPDLEVRKRISIPSLTQQETTVVNQIVSWAITKASGYEGI